MVLGGGVSQTNDHCLVYSALFLATLAIREHDFLFEKTWLHWSIPALITGLSAVAWAWFQRDKIASALTAWTAHPASSMLLVGLATLLVFSRLFGKEALWQTMLGDNYHRSMKNMVEESTELFGYALIVASLCLHVMLKPRLLSQQSSNPINN